MVRHPVSRPIDVLHLGRDRVICAYEVDGVIVDPGPASCVETLIDRLGPTEPRVLPLVVRSRTSDGVEVVALADLTVLVRDVEPGSTYAPATQAARLAEVAVARAVEQLEVESLVDDLEALETRWPGQLTRLLPVGTAATALAVTEVEARLTGGAA